MLYTQKAAGSTPVSSTSSKTVQQSEEQRGKHMETSSDCQGTQPDLCAQGQYNRDDVKLIRLTARVTVRHKYFSMSSYMHPGGISAEAEICGVLGDSRSE
jgi:hypothetical protein